MVHLNLSLGQKKVVIVERFKQESMYGLSPPQKKISPCGEVPISRGSTLVPPPVTNFRFPHPHPPSLF